MLKRIFIPLENSTSIDSAIKHACFIAYKQEAIITAGVFLDIPGAKTWLGNYKDDQIIWMPDIDKTIISDSENIIIHLINKFKAECKKNDVEYSIIQEVGIPIQELEEIIKYYDILVTSFNSEFRIGKRKFDSTYLNQMLNYGVTPILAVPSQFSGIKNILIIYDASVAAARALQRFARIAKFNQFKINIIMSSENSTHGMKHLREAKSLLQIYGATNVSIELTRKDIMDTLNSLYDFKPDLIVMGLHSKKIFQDYFVGSVTKELIKKANIPLFIGM